MKKPKTRIVKIYEHNAREFVKIKRRYKRRSIADVVETMADKVREAEAKETDKANN